MQSQLYCGSDLRNNAEFSVCGRLANNVIDNTQRRLDHVRCRSASGLSVEDEMPQGSLSGDICAVEFAIAMKEVNVAVDSIAEHSL